MKLFAIWFIYVYPRKDYVKHRSGWFDVFCNEVSAAMSQSIEIFKGYGMRIVYAISPGFRIFYSSETDLAALKRKFDKVKDVSIMIYYLMILKVKRVNTAKIV